MAEETRRESQWGQLSLELWNMVLTHLQNTASTDQKESVMRKLPMVCKRFGEVLRLSHFRSIRVSRQLTVDRIVSLCDWIRHHDGFVNQWFDVSSGMTDAFLLVLRSHGVSLVRLDVLCQIASVRIIAGFTGLVHCTLRQPNRAGTPSLSLEALQALPSLTTLSLKGGTFTHVEVAAKHLTELLLTSCRAVCSHGCVCVSSLVMLEMKDSHLVHFHEHGLSACNRLVSLSLINCAAKANNQVESFINDGLFLVPRSMAALTQLTGLEFTRAGEVELDWLKHLTNLERLVVFGSSAPTNVITFPEGTSALTALTYLCLAATQVNAELRVAFDWAGLIKLEELGVHGNLRLTDQFELCALATLSKLRAVIFTALTKPDQCLTGQLALLAHCLGTNSLKLP